MWRFYNREKCAHEVSTYIGVRECVCVGLRIDHSTDRNNVGAWWPASLVAIWDWLSSKENVR